jgi:serine phosphatase RsbU (regulator of sigma subunit)
VTVATSGGDHLPAECERTAPGGELDILRRLAVRLQLAVAPPGGRPAGTPGIEVAARSRPAQQGPLGAGDWYDTFLLPGGDFVFVVGDIAGHGIEAVADMVVARNALRGLAATGAEPDELLGLLNRAVCLYAEELTGTVVCGRYTPESRELRWARAGHLPLVLVREGAAQIPPMPDGMLLGIGAGARYQLLRLRLRAGDTLLFFTDGLIERKAASISDALAEFAAAAAPVGADLGGHVAGLLAGAVSDTGDDACLLAARIL